MSNFWARTFTGIVFITVVLGSIWLGATVFSIVTLVIALAALHEFYTLIPEQKAASNLYSGLILGAFSFISLSGLMPAEKTATLIPLLAPLTAIIFFAELYRKKPEPIQNIGLTLMGVVYVVVPFILLIRTGFLIQEGVFYRGLVAGIFFLIWSNDTFAYLVGSKLGKTKLFERISPKKSWEGSIGGVLFTFGTAWLLNYYNPEVGMVNWMVIAFIVCITGTLGDLTESLFKRALGVKDSGNILPGHGGLLDRFDAVLLSIPFVWAWLQLAASGS